MQRGLSVGQEEDLRLLRKFNDDDFDFHDADGIDGFTDPRAETDEWGFLKVSIPEQEMLPTMTAGEIIRRLSVLPDDHPVIGYVQRLDCAHGERYVNITDLWFDPENGPAAQFEIQDTHDTRQY